MRRFFTAAGLCLALSLPAGAQTNRGPAELPPADFEGREYTDSQGCVFLRSTFGGEVTWVPRFGPDRQPVCNGTEEVAAQNADDDTTPNDSADAAQPEEQQQVAEQPVPQPAGSNASQIAPIAPTAKAPAPRPRAAARAPQRSAPARPKADSSGRHPNCPASAPYGQLVDTMLGRPMVRCVTSPSLFLPEYAGPGAALAPKSQHRPTAAGRGHVVQAGSFSVPANATRLRSRFQAAGLPARIHVARGLHVVTVGPFGDRAQLHSALATAQRMGLRDAFIR